MNCALLLLNGGVKMKNQLIGFAFGIMVGIITIMLVWPESFWLVFLTIANFFG